MARIVVVSWERLELAGRGRLAHQGRAAAGQHGELHHLEGDATIHQGRRVDDLRPPL